MDDHGVGHGRVGELRVERRLDAIQRAQDVAVGEPGVRGREIRRLAHAGGKLGAGRLDDTGDLDGIPDTVVQVANWNNALRAVREKPEGAETQRLNAGADYAATAVRLVGGVWRFVLTHEQFATYGRNTIPTPPAPTKGTP